MADGINLGKAYVQIIPSAEGISGSISNVLGGEAESAGRSSGQKFGSAMGGVLKTGFGLAATGIATMGTFTKSIIDSSKQTAAAGDQIDKMSQKLGLSAKAYQEWDYVLGQSGADITSMSTGIKTLTNKLDDAKNGSESAQSMFAALGLSMDDLGKMSREDVFAAVISGFQGMEDSTERAALANDLFGKSGQELTPLFNTTIAETEAMKKAANDLGMVMSDEAVKGSADFVDAMDNFSRAMDGAKNQLSANFLPGLTEVTNGLAGLIAGTDGASEQITAGFETIASGITEALPRIIETIRGLAISFAEVAPELIGTLAQAIVDSVPELMPAVTELILQLSQMFIEMLPQLIEVGLQVILQLSLGIASALPDLIPTIVDVVLQIVETLVENVDLLIDAAIALITGLAEGLINALPRLVEKAPIIVEKLVTGIINNLPKIAKASLDLIVEFAKGIVTNLPQILEAGGKILSSLVDGIGSMLGSLGSILVEIGGMILEVIGGPVEKAFQWGADLIGNFIDGIGSMAGALWDGICDIGAGIVDFLGFSEPEKGPLSNFHTFAPDMMKLFAEGVEQNIGLVTGSVEDASEQIADALSGDLSNAAINVAANISPVDLEGVDAQGMAARKGQQGTDLASLIALLSEYLPMLANGVVNVTLEGDAEGIFNVVRSQNKIYKRMNGASAFA